MSARPPCDGTFSSGATPRVLHPAQKAPASTGSPNSSAVARARCQGYTSHPWMFAARPLTQAVWASTPYLRARFASTAIGGVALSTSPTATLRASVRRHRRAQGGSPMRRRSDRRRLLPGDGIPPPSAGFRSATRLRSGQALVSVLGKGIGRGATSARPDHTCRRAGSGRRSSLTASSFPHLTPSGQD